MNAPLNSVESSDPREPSLDAAEQPTEQATEHDFTIPEDADFTTPGQPATGEQHRSQADESNVTADGQSGPASTPGNPIGEQH